MNAIFKSVAVIAICGFISACSTTDSNKVASVDVTNSGATYDPIKDPSTVVYNKKSVWFDFDSSTIKSEYQSVVKAHAEYLRANKEKGVRILIQGNTDERGTTEYNLALGQRRSESVKKALSVYGVDASQVEAVSLGKEKPVANGHDESAWKQNRRADIVYK
jgi:peptidoglycan-associated lipoprotein